MPLRRQLPPPPPPAPAPTDRRGGLRIQGGLRPLAEVSRQIEVADGYADIRGWMVTASGGVVAGSVRDLIIDPQAMVVRYLDIELGPPGTDAGLGRHVLLPVSAVELHPGTDEVRAAGMRPVDFLDLPEFRRELLNKDSDAGLLRRIGVKAVMQPDDMRITTPEAGASAPASPPTRQDPPQIEG